LVSKIDIIVQAKISSSFSGAALDAGYVLFTRCSGPLKPVFRMACAEK
jgi:hypothetical protein